MKVLVVDDTASIRRLLRLTLEAEGVIVLVVIPGDGGGFQIAIRFAGLDLFKLIGPKF